MMPIDLSDPIYTDEQAARRHLETIQWPDGAFCPFCGGMDKVIALGGEQSMGPGWYHCGDCRKKFTVRVGTVYERSHIPLHKWLLAFRLMASSKKGMSAHQLHRTLGISYKSAWFLAHRIREAMKDGNPSPIGGKGSVVEADESYFGRKQGMAPVTGGGHKHAVVALVERGGRSRTVHVAKVTGDNVRAILEQHVNPGSQLHTDEAKWYRKPGKNFVAHYSVNHSREEWVRGGVHTNTVEGFFSIFKRGMRGVYQHCSEQHLQRYLTEFDFRYSNRIALGVDDAERTLRAVKGATGKRLTYRRTREREGEAIPF